MTSFIVTAPAGSVILTQPQFLILLDAQIQALRTLSKRRDEQIEAWKNDESGRLEDYLGFVKSRLETEYRDDYNYHSFWHSYKRTLLDKILGRHKRTGELLVSFDSKFDFALSKLGIKSRDEFIVFAVSKFTNHFGPWESPILWERLMQVDSYHFNQYLINSYKTLLPDVEERERSVMRSDGTFVLTDSEFKYINKLIDSSTKPLEEIQKTTYRGPDYDYWDC